MILKRNTLWLGLMAIIVMPPSYGAKPSSGSLGVPVSVEAVQKMDFAQNFTALGTVTPLHSVTVRSRVDGALEKIYFREGSYVASGNLLAEIDSRTYQLQKKQAEAQLARDMAMLDMAKLDLARFKTLLAQESVSQQQVDTQAALVRQLEATLKIDQVKIDEADLMLGYSRIVSPISGRIGFRSLDPGNLVSSSDPTGLAVITQMDPISVIFSVPQDHFAKVFARFEKGEVIPVEARDKDGLTQLGLGRLVSIDHQFEASTGTVKMRAVFDNRENKLFPQQFVNCILPIENIAGATVVSPSAVQYGTMGAYVYVIAEQKKAELRKVDKGAREKNKVVIAKGLSVGEWVVVDGLDKLRDGAPVDIVRGDKKN